MNFRFLISYAYFKNRLPTLTDYIDQLDGHTIELFADSGAFTIETRRLKHGQDAADLLHDYAEWLTEWQHLFNGYANLDVILDPDATAKNQHHLETQYDLNPIPVFHMSTPYSVLEDLLTDYDYIALGGMVRKDRKVLMRHLIRCFTILRETGDHKKGFHAFGWSNPQAFELPFFSADSSGWVSATKYGVVGIYEPTLHKLIRVPLSAGSLKNPRSTAAVGKYAHRFRELGWDPNDFYGEWDWRDLFCFSAANYIRWEQHERERHGDLEIPGYGIGPKIYLVASNMDMITQVIDRWRPTAVLKEE